MNDAAIPIAYAMNVSPQRYALFLGAGISISAGLPTGAEVAAQLIRDYAATEGEIIEGDDNPAVCIAWYTEKTGRAPTFDLLMESLGIGEQNRADTLRPIVLPIDESGKPLEPTIAHGQIAQLVKDGLVKLIITTNFDPLLERAISEIAWDPVVITPESDPALMSIIPDKCRIIKVNGDFSNGKLKITPEDLISYNPTISDYLRRIYNEYGLVICGWSSDYDTGMTEILGEVSLRRYPVFWCHRPDREIPATLIGSIKPIPIEIASADDFFTEVQAILSRLKNLERRQPLTIPLAIKKVTDALQQPRPEIILSDLIHKETDSIIDLLSEKGYVPIGTVHIPTLFQERIERLHRATAPLAAILATIANYDDNQYCDLLFDVVERLINVRVSTDDPFTEGARQFTGSQNGVHRVADCLYALRLFPALLVVYSAGITATKNEHFNMLESILKPKIGRPSFAPERDVAYYEDVNSYNMFGGCDIWLGLNRAFYGEAGNYYTFLFQEVHRIVSHLIPSKYRYSQLYDIFEYLYSLAFLYSYSGEITRTNLIRGRFPALETKLCNTTFRTGSPSYPSGGLRFPQSLQRYFEEFEGKVSGTRFFNGDLTALRQSNARYAEIFGIDPLIIG